MTSSSGANNSRDSAVNGENNASAVKMVRVAVGSANPAKIRAVQLALHQACQISHDVQWHVEGFPVPSGVSDQPFGDSETRRGAKNRARAAFVRYTKDHKVQPHLAVGLEGGLEWVNDEDSAEDDENTETDSQKNGTGNRELYCMAWMAIYGRRQVPTVEIFASPQAQSYYGDKKPIFGTSKTASFLMPPAIVKLINEGMELGDADDQAFGRTNSKQGSGTVGILTDGLVDRSRYYEHALLLALTAWIRPDVYHATT